MKFIIFALLTGLVAAAPKKANIARQLEGLADGGYSIDAAGNITPLPSYPKNQTFYDVVNARIDASASDLDKRQKYSDVACTGHPINWFVR